MNWFRFLLFFLPSTLVLADVGDTVGGQSAGMGFTSVSFSNQWSAINNQAGLSLHEEIQFGVYVENKFLLSELSLFGAAVSIPTKSGTFGLGLTYFGDEFYNESVARLGFGRQMSENFHAGIELDYVSVSANEFGSANALTFGFGVLYQINPRFHVGAHFFNPLSTTLTDLEDDDLLESSLRIGLSYLPSDKILFTLEAEKRVEDPLISKFGIDYLISDSFSLRAGYATEPDILTFGVGFLLGQLNIDLASSFHLDLGMSPHLSISYLLPKKK